VKYQSLRGMRDILPGETPLWQKIESAVHEIFRRFGYSEIRTPLLEKTELFSRSIGGSTDIVSKEMYTFTDKGDRSVTLRPEETAPVVRAAIENNLISADKLTKLYYIGPMFRYERPQAGRLRQFHQAGVEAIGSTSPLLDAEVILLGIRFFEGLGIKGLEVDMNSVGCPKCRPGYIKKLKSFLKEQFDALCRDCRTRYETNPLRVLDCKNEECSTVLSKAPALSASLCENCAGSLESARGLLSDMGIKTSLNNRLVRGLDYYTGTTFEIVSRQLGSQSALCGGGRYDGLIEELGGPKLPAVGFAIGIERLIMLLKEQKIADKGTGSKFVYLAALGPGSQKEAFLIMNRLRSGGIRADMDHTGKSLKSCLKTASQLQADYTVIIGDEELSRKAAIIKDMKTGEQKEAAFERIIEEIK